MTPVCEALEVKIERLRKNHFAGMEVMRSFALEIIEALSAAPGEPCAVKSLEWRDGPYATETIVADSIFGQYTAWYIEPHGLWQSPTTHAGTICGNSLSAAKAAAQADYEQRIKSALVFEGRK